MNPEFLATTGEDTRVISVDTGGGGLAQIEVYTVDFDTLIALEDLYGIPAYLEDN